MATTTLSKDAVVMLDSNDITDFVSDFTNTRSADSLDVTTYGNDSHRKRGGLFDGAFTMGGVYDTTANGPHDVIKPLVGTIVALEVRPEGTGSGLPATTVNVLVQQYEETQPVADIVRWTCSLEADGDVTDADQS